MNRIAPEAYRDLVRQALAEDRGRGDATSAATIAKGTRARGTIVAKSDLVVAGIDVAAEAFRQLDPQSVFEVRWGDGSRVQPGEVVANVRGDAHALLEAERTALNFLQRLSGIATLTAKFVDAAGGGITILDTRKTTPGFRVLEKYAVRCGGGTNHRHRLDDGILIKDNHKRLGGGVAAAATRAMEQSGGLPVVVEVETLDELDEVLEDRCAAHPARQLQHLRYSRSRQARERTGGDRDLGRRDARAHTRARHHRRATMCRLAR